MKTIIRTIRMAGYAVLFSACGFGVQANLIQDPGFEQPVAGPGGFNTGYLAFNVGSTIGGAWTVIGSPSGDVALTPSTEYTYTVGPIITFTAQEGAQWLDLTGNTDSGAATGVQQTFPTVAGRPYSLSFYVGAVTTPDWAPDQGNAAVNVLLNGTAFQTSINNDPSGDTMDWKQFNYTFTATSASTTLAFINAVPAGEGANGVDNVTVVAAPEPGTWNLLALGLGTLFAVARRHKSI